MTVATAEPKTSTESLPAANACPHCKGTGSIGTWVAWSDGLGGSSATCPVCDGAKTIDFDPVAELARLKSQLRSFIYSAWLVAGCHIEPYRKQTYREWVAAGRKGTNPDQWHQQANRNEVLRMLKEFEAGKHLDIEPNE